PGRIASLLLARLLWRQAIGPKGWKILAAQSTRPGADGKFFPSAARHLDHFHQPIYSGGSPLHLHSGRDRSHAVGSFSLRVGRRRNHLEHVPAFLWLETA